MIITINVKMSKSIKIIIADSHKIYSKKLGELLFREKCIESITNVRDTKDLLCETVKRVHDVILIDFDLITKAEHDFIKQIGKLDNNIKIIVLLMHADAQVIQELIEYGAHGYLLKKSDFQEFQFAIKSVLDGKVHLCKDVA